MKRETIEAKGQAGSTRLPRLHSPYAHSVPMTAAMAEVAKANGVQFVDLFTPSQQLYSQAARPLTINGIHLTEEGDKVLPVLDRFAPLISELKG